MKADQIIEAFGGKRQTAERFGVSLATVYLWESNGKIPTKRWSDAVRIAQREGIAGVTLDGLSAVHTREPA